MMTPVTRLQHICTQTPSRVLFTESSMSLDAATLYMRASQLAGHLHECDVGPGSNVAFYLPRGLDAVATIYGILMAGACYVPLSEQFPAERNSFILQHADCQRVVVVGVVPAWLAEAGVEVIRLDTLAKCQPESMRHNSLPVDVSLDANAAILYTSGSTGQPKGVVISMRAIDTFSEWCVTTFSLCQEDRIASLAPFHFDLSLFDLFAAAAAGAETCFIPEALKLAPARLVDWLDYNNISTWYTVPSMLGMLTMKGGLDKHTLPRLRQVLFAGEIFPLQRLQRFAALMPDLELFNLFGPTETNVCLYWPVDRSRLEESQMLPVGGSACGAVLRMDAEQGELLVKGPCLMSGYWQQGKVVPVIDAQGWFHSGDRVTVNDQGEYLFHGRLDRMIKSAGYRVEPAEIEQVLQAVPGVMQVAVVGIPDALSGTRIAAAVAVDGADRVSLHNHASKQLSSWMRPSFYLILNTLPNLPNGKTDYQGITRAIERELSA